MPLLMAHRHTHKQGTRAHKINIFCRKKTQGHKHFSRPLTTVNDWDLGEPDNLTDLQVANDKMMYQVIPC